MILLSLRHHTQLWIGTLVMSTALLSGCGGGGTSTPNSNERDNPNTDYSCDFKLNDGRGSFDLVPAEITQTYFGKKFDRSWLTALKKSSGQATLNFIDQILHVHVYRTNRASTGQCQAFARLPFAPADLQQDWNTHILSDSALMLSGIYLAAPKLAIIVQADSNKWTLLHEMLHHDFQTQRDIQKQPALSVREKQYQDAKTIADAIYAKSDLTHEDADQYFLQLNIMLSQKEAYIVNGPLEEIAVEVQMRDFYRNNQMSYIPNKVNSSQAYISESAKAALDEYDDMLNQYNQAVSYFTTLRFPGSVGVAAKWNELITNRKNEIAQIVARYGVGPISTDASLRSPPAVGSSTVGFSASAITALTPSHEGACTTDSQFESFFGDWKHISTK